MGIRHKHVAQGQNDPDKEVSRDRWNEDHELVGEMQLPGLAADPSPPANGTLWLDTATGEVRVRSAGQTRPIGPTAWADVTGKPSFAAVATTGAYSDLTGAPALAPIATSGSASDLSAGTLPAARFNDTAHGNRAGGALHAAATGSVAGFMAAADKTKLDGVATGATANATDAALRDRALHTGTQLASTISNFGSSVIAVALTGFAAAGTRTAIVVTDTILAAFGKVQKYLNDLSALAFSGNATDLSGTKTATFISDFSEAVDDRVAALLVPGTNVTLTYNDAANTLTVAATGGGGGGSPAGVDGDVQIKSGSSFAAPSGLTTEGGQLRLPAIALPSVPAASGLKLFGSNVSGLIMPAWQEPEGRLRVVQPFLGLSKVRWWAASGNGLPDTQSGVSMSGTGTATAVSWAAGSFRNQISWRSWRVTTASATAVVGLRNTASNFTLGGDAARRGGFYQAWVWSPDTGVANASHRAFVGLINGTAAPTDVNPSTLIRMCGMGYDAADTNIQFMHNDAAGSATKIDLGASFPKPNVDGAKAYLIEMSAPPGTTQLLRYRITDLDTEAVATGSVLTDLPTTTQPLSPNSYMSVGGVSNVIGMAHAQLYVQADF
jgi:hypothetical protein